ncbi:MAG: hypothetical protein WC490_08005 [Candidatus Margulisiibacteriota bacterium]
MVSGPSDIGLRAGTTQKAVIEEKKTAVPAENSPSNGTKPVYSEESLPITNPPIDPSSIAPAEKEQGGWLAAIGNSISESLKDPAARRQYLALVEGQFNEAIDKITEPDRNIAPPDLSSIENQDANEAVQRAIDIYSKGQKNDKLGSDKIRLDKNGGLSVDGPREDRIRNRLENQLKSIGLAEEEIQKALVKFDGYVEETRTAEVKHLKWDTQRKITNLIKGGPGRLNEMERELKVLEAADRSTNGGNLTADTDKFAGQIRSFITASNNKDTESACRAAVEIFKPLIEQSMTYYQYDKALYLDDMMRDSIKKIMPGRNTEKEVSEILKSDGYTISKDSLKEGREVQDHLNEIITAFSEKGAEAAREILEKYPDAGEAVLKTLESTGIYVSDEEKNDILDSEPFQTILKPYKRLMDENLLQSSAGRHGFMRNTMLAITRSVPRMFEGVKALVTPGDGISTREALSSVTGGAAALLRSPAMMLGAAGTELVQGTIGSIWKGASGTAAGRDAVDERFISLNRHAETVTTLLQPLAAGRIATGIDTLLNLKERFEDIRSGVAHGEGPYIGFGAAMNLMGL